MLREFIASLLTFATGHARRLGYVHEGIAIEARRRRCGNAWAGHLEACHQAILAAMGGCSRRGTAVILGSGPLYDIPVAALAGAFARLVLIDVFHPPRARRQARLYPNLVLLDHDLLGLEEGCGGGSPGALSRWRGIVPDADFVVSANLLAQLPLLPVEYWLRHGVPEAEVARRSQAMMAAHLDDLRSGGHPCLISEWRRRWHGPDGSVTDEEMPLAELGLAMPETSWIWRLAPPGELPGDASLILDVGLFDPFKVPPALKP